MTASAAAWTPPLLMGVLNVTPDSFSDGGQFQNLEAALMQARKLVDEGADIIDVGGESTRPGSQRVPLEVEQQRVLPVIRAIRAEMSVPISVDTMNSATAEAAVSLGAQFINDVSGGKSDARMFGAAAASQSTFILGHWRGPSATMDSLASYRDVAREVVSELEHQVSAAVAAGIDTSRLIVDPGLGFAKDVAQNWQLVARLDELERLGLPVLVGASRKRFLAAALADGDSASVGNDRRDLATAVLTALLLQRGLWAVRVHNVSATRDAIALVSALKKAEVGSDS